MLVGCNPTQDNGSPNAVSSIPAVLETVDPYLWLEEVEGDRAITWVNQQNKRSVDEIQSQFGYEANLAAAIELSVSKARIPYGSIRNSIVYNFWQDEANVRGLWRRTPLANYGSAEPDWETVLDIDELATNEDKNWVFKGAECLQRQGVKVTRCMIALSDGGKDAVIRREFDLESRSFVESGFVTTEAKHDIAWIDRDTLLVGTDWNGDGSTLTASGYASSLRRWKRGQPMNEALELYSVPATHVGVFTSSVELDSGKVIYWAQEAATFFSTVYTLLHDEKPLRIPVPPKSVLGSIYKGYQFVTLQQDWELESQQKTFHSGDLIAFNIQSFLDSRQLPPVELVFRANERQAVSDIRVSKRGALLSIIDNVASRLLQVDRDAAGWTTTEIQLPGSGKASIVFADKHVDTTFVNYEGFLTPDSLLKLDGASNSLSVLKSLPAKFNSQGLIVEQKYAASKDGTSVPYFVVRREDTRMDGSTPTLLYGYGGFEISMSPRYSAGIGRLWLEKGGAYVLANIRGGGEFGPAWHQAGLKQNRQRIYDDFIAVAEDLLASKLTSTRHLGIMGGSNGGLLMGVMMVQRPELWNAIVVQVPLLDMLRYHKLLAGASWVDEYGDPDVPEERAFLETISPYSNFDPDQKYPIPFFVTSTKDDRVHPGHARKMAKRFEESGKPFLYYENVDGGHSAAANRKERAKRMALEFTYLSERLFDEAALTSGDGA
jgi:prolyl oligopeptidase